MRAFAAAVGAVVFALAVPAGAAPGPADAPEYWFDDWQVPALWDAGARGQDITIAEIDSGVNAGLPELTGRVLAGRDFGPGGGDGRLDRSRDRFGHGTAMASLMVARPGLFGIEGLAPDAKVLPVAIPLAGTTDSRYGDHLPEAIRWAADHGAKIISMSLGGDAQTGPGATACTTDEQDAIFHALTKGVVLFAASGNDGTQPTAQEPGVCLGVVSVGAVDRADEVADFSSRHPYLTLSAPGVNIPTLSRVAGAAYAGDGTSQATAIVSAVAALTWSAHPQLSGRQVVARLLATLDHRRASRDPGFGYGIVDASAAVAAAVPRAAADPVYQGVAPFLARAAALSRPMPTVPPAAVAQQPPGSYRVEAAPGTDARTMWGVVLAAVGAGVLLVLLVVGALGRRRHSRGTTQPGIASA